MSSIELTREIVKPAKDPIRKHVWPVRITAKGSGIDSKIFVYHAAMDDDPLLGDIFEAVASVLQLNEVPPDKPATLDGVVIPFYRLSVLEYDARSAEQAEHIWAVVQEDADDLSKNFDSAKNLEGIEVVIVGGDA